MRGADTSGFELDFDPEALAARLALGEPVNDLIFRSDQAESKAMPAVATEP